MTAVVQAPRGGTVRPRAATRELLALAVALALGLLAVAGRYGYHRDELYFQRAGREASYGSADQGPFTP